MEREAFLAGRRQLRTRIDAQQTKSHRRRPTKILNTSQRNFEVEIIAAANRKTSPLLKLPPEIRNRIYELVLHCGRIHVTADYQPCYLEENKDVAKLRRSICVAVEEDSAIAKRIGDSKSFASAEDYGKRHSKCHEDSPSSLFTFAQTCRQIHREAAVLPYELNDLHFATPNVFAHFLHTTIPAHRKAIRSGVIYSHFTNHDELAKPKTITGMRSMTKLDTLHLYMETPQDVKIFINSGPASTVYKDLWRYLEPYTSLQNLQLSKARVTICPSQEEDGFVPLHALRWSSAHTLGGALEDMLMDREAVSSSGGKQKEGVMEKPKKKRRKVRRRGG